MNSPRDTIVAVASPPGRALRGLLRLSGPDTERVLRSLAAESSWPAGCLVPCRLRAPSPGGNGPMPTVPGLVLLRRGPSSYTGGDLAEIQCPGNPALLERLVRRALDAGARLAEPGEFTFRAFLARRLDLTQAEGIAATIAATSDSQLRAAAHLRRGELGRFAAGLGDALSELLALVEAAIDFVDQEDVRPIGAAELDRRLADLAARLQALVDRSRSWRALEALPAVILAGAPGAGKSTLFNALLGRRRALTSQFPGTTRDVLVEPLELRSPDGHRIEVRLVDIAGLDEPAGELDRQAQAAARAAIENADLVVHVLGGEDDGESAPRWAAPVVLRVRTRADLDPGPGGSFDVLVSGRTGRGLAELRRAIAARVGERGTSLAADALALQPRHDAALRAAGTHLDAARRLLEAEPDPGRIDRPELVAGSLRDALDELGSLVGRMTPDDILGRVFKTFCIGK